MGFLIQYIENLCAECQSDRMTCVLSPMCRRRFLIKIRILTGSLMEDLPKFCYAQVISNLKRFKDKKTALYTPIDELVYVEDLFDIFFPKISKDLVNFCISGKIKEAVNIITKSKIPANYSKSQKEKQGILRNILKLDKMIKEGSFIYDISQNYFVIWNEKNLYIANIKNGYAICNAHREIIDSIELLNLILPLYAEGKDFGLKIETDETEISSINMWISGKRLKNLEKEILFQKLNEVTEKIPIFPRASFTFTPKEDLEIVIEVDNTSSFDDLDTLFNNIDNLTESENIYLLSEIKDR